MSTTATISVPRTKLSPRTKLLASVSGLVAAASIVATLAVGLGSGDASSARSSSPASANPDRATLYQHSAQMPRSGAAVDGQRSAERFHHFR